MLVIQQNELFFFFFFVFVSKECFRPRRTTKHIPAFEGPPRREIQVQRRDVALNLEEVQRLRNFDLRRALLLQKLPKRRVPRA